MKKVLIFLSALALIIQSCKNAEDEGIISFIPGVYVKQITDEFTDGMDTLTISEMDRQNGSYKIIRKISYRQKIDGKALPPKEDVHTWVAIYLAETRQLRVQNQDKTFTFFPKKGLLSMGSSEYKKIGNK